MIWVPTKRIALLKYNEHTFADIIFRITRASMIFSLEGKVMALSLESESSTLSLILTEYSWTPKIPLNF
ncbi:LOW QUALITY PROTEIN: hypothetical protein HZS_2473 [Henneguya salminicola]|nr:LOW QUALITY PROTEIN: hypothetical protein HZS_2473 [Henneguya salminicola]